MSDMDDSLMSDISELSRSPTPPSDSDYKYIFSNNNLPSPPSSLQTSSQESTPSPPESMTRSDSQCGEDGAPPAKRRRVTEPKPRTTEQLDLSDSDVESNQKDQLDTLLKVLHRRRKIVVIAGAGISVSAGIPDFRSSTGLFKSLKSEHGLKSSGKDLFDASVYKDNKSTDQFHDMVRNLSLMTKKAEPTAFHHLLATLAQQNRLLRLYTQNVDCIDTQLPPLATDVPLPRKGPWPKTVQLHGSVEKMVCSKCHKTSDLDPDLFSGPIPAACRHCVETDAVRTEHAGKRSHGIGRLRPRMVLYNEWNPDEEAIGAVCASDLSKRPDALIVVGTTLKIPGVRRLVKELCGVIRGRREGTTIWVNNDPPPPGKDFEWDLIVKGQSDEVARRACMRKWDEDDAVESATEDQMVQAMARQSPQVVICSPAKSKTFERVQGVPTPAASPRAEPIKLNLKFGPLDGQNAEAKQELGGGKKKVAAKRNTKSTTAPKPKRQTQKKPAEKKPANNTKISFRVGKAVSQPVSKKNKETSSFSSSLQQQQNSLPDRSSTTTTLFASKPMQPVSPSSIRNNAAPPFAQAPTYSNELPNLKKRGLKVEITPSKETPEERRRTISPQGPIPADLVKIINF